MNDVQKYLKQNQERYIRELTEWLAIPSISAKSEHQGDVLRAATWAERQLVAAGLENVTVHETTGHPIVTGQTPHVAGAPTVLVYGHYDVQPPEPLELWTSPAFEPTVRGTALFARGSADDKGQAFIYLKVLEAFKEVRGSCPLNVKVLLEGEEEIGSPSLIPFLKQHKKDLKCDVVLVSDTHMLGVSTPSITTGLRGMTCFEVRVETTKQDLHSGTFGGSVANPIQTLAQMLVACKDGKTGKIKIPEFYRDVRKLTAKQRKSLAAIPHDDAKYARGLGAKQVFGERGYSTKERVGARPTFEINGLWGGYTGEGMKTVLPCRAQAKVSMRLVANQNPRHIGKQFKAFMEQIAPPYAKVKVTRMENDAVPSMVDPDFPEMKIAAEAVRKVFKKEPIYTLEGGSIPIVADFKRILKRDTILLGFGLPDDNLHAPDEKFDLRMLARGMQTIAQFFDDYAGA